MALKKLKRKTVIVFSPHDDDETIGMGGTTLKLVKKGYKIIKVVFSSGEKSNPHLRKSVVVRRRKNLSMKVAKASKLHKLISYNLNDLKLSKELPRIKTKINRLIGNYKPFRVYIPSIIDTHPDHRAVNKFILDLLKDQNIEILSYEVWGGIDQQHPVIYEDISKYLKDKIKMIKMFTQTEWFSVYMQLLPVYFRAKRYGSKAKCKYAERFYRLK